MWESKKPYENCEKNNESSGICPLFYASDKNRLMKNDEADPARPYRSADS
jgi:hypothetical protein